MTGTGDHVTQATAAWVEVREDGNPLLCIDTEQGTTETFELNRKVAAELRIEFLEGPTVRHDTEETEA